MSHLSPGAGRWSGWAVRLWPGLAGLSPPEQANIRVLTIDTALFGIVEAGIGSFLAVFLVRLEAPNILVGLVASLPSVGAVLLSVPASRWVSRWPNLVRTVVRWRLLMRSSYLAIAVVPLFLEGPLAYFLIILFWGLSSIPAAIVNLAWTEVVARIIPAERRPMVNGVRWALFSVVTAAAGALFGVMLDWLPFPGNYQVVFAISFLAGLATCYTFSRIRLVVDERVSAPTSSRLGLLDLIEQVRAEPAFARFLISTFIYRIGLNLPVPLFSIYWVTVMHASDTLIGLRTSVAYAALIVSYLFWGWLAARHGPRRVLLWSSAGVSLYPLATAASSDLFWLMPVALLWGWFVSGIDISFFEVLLRTIPPERRAVLVAVNSSLANLAIFAAPLVGAALADTIGLVAALWLAGGLSLLGTLLMALLSVAGGPAQSGAKGQASQ